MISVVPKCMFSEQLWGRHITTTTTKFLQSCLTLCDPIDGSPPGSPIPGILEARILEWVAISFSNVWKWKVKMKSLSHVRLLATPELQPTRLLCPWDVPGKSTGVGCHCHLKFHLINEFCIKTFLCRESAWTLFLYLNEYSYEEKCLRKTVLDGEKWGIFKIKISKFQVN